METSKLVSEISEYLDKYTGPLYQEQPLAQDWARISKVSEELGEAIQEFIGVTGQNPRKGYHGSYQTVIKELLDTCATGLLAVEHFTHDGQSWERLAKHVEYLHGRLYGQAY